MATAPAMVTCTKDTWVKVAESVTAATIDMINGSPTAYLSTWRSTGEAAPTLASEGVSMFGESFQAVVQAGAAIDVYVMALGSAGQVRVSA
jgi:hypothetical protein